MTHTMLHLQEQLSAGRLTKTDIIERLHRHIDTAGRVNDSLTQCWKWTGSSSKHGYGWITICSKSFQAHRVSWWVHNDTPVITPEQIVRHKCDNPTCCNPEHLEIGTSADNTADAFARGRRPTGALHPRAKYTDEDINTMKQLYDEGLPVIRIAELYDTTSSYVSRLLAGKHRKVSSQNTTE